MRASVCYQHPKVQSWQKANILVFRICGHFALRLWVRHQLYF